MSRNASRRDSASNLAAHLYGSTAEEIIYFVTYDLENSPLRSIGASVILTQATTGGEKQVVTLLDLILSDQYPHLCNSSAEEIILTFDLENGNKCERVHA